MLWHGRAFGSGHSRFWRRFFCRESRWLAAVRHRAALLVCRHEPMPALPLPIYGLESLHLFPTYQTRESYETATGQPCPPWDPNRQPKAWFDAKAMESARRNVVYDQVLAVNDRGIATAGSDGKPMLDVLVLRREEAATVNIQRKRVLGMGEQDYGSETDVPVPLRALDADEELAFQFGGTVCVHNKRLFEAQTAAGGFTAADRAKLDAIAKKLGV